MSKGINHSCANVWRAIARAGQWASLGSVVNDWDGVYSAGEVAEHLDTLVQGGFLEVGESHRDGDMYAYTPECHQLPGETLRPVAGRIDFESTVAAPRRNDVMNTVYTPPQQTYRPGAMDYQQCPSLHMGKRHPFRSHA